MCETGFSLQHSAPTAALWDSNQWRGRKGDLKIARPQVQLIFCCPCTVLWICRGASHHPDQERAMQRKEVC